MAVTPNSISTNHTLLHTANPGRVFIYGLLRDICNTPPNADFLHELEHSGPLQSLAAHSQGACTLVKAVRGALNAVDRAVPLLRSEYANLFVGPGALPAPLWESAALGGEHLLFGTHTVQVREFYARVGLHCARNGQEPDDHLALELDCMAQLAVRTQSALEEGNALLLQSLIEAQEEFLLNHMVLWVPASLRLMLPHCGPFFAGAATLGMEFLALEPDLLTHCKY